MDKKYLRDTRMLPEGIEIYNDIYDGDDNIIINNISINDKLLIFQEYKQYSDALTSLEEQYPEKKFIYNIHGEAYPVVDFSDTFNSPYFRNHPIMNTYNHFKDKRKLDKLIFKTNNLSIKYESINHEPTVFWIGKSKIESDIDLDIQRNFTTHFLMQIRDGRRNIRGKLFNQLKELNLLNHFQYSFNSGDSEREDYKSLEDGPIKDELDIHQMYIKDYFLTSFINIVCESYFKNDNVFLTEKIDKPILAKQPFIVFGSNGYLSKLKELGFKTFDKWWDESYDNIVDEDERFNKIFDLILKIKNYTLDECNEMYNEMKEILNHNYNNRIRIKKLYNHDGNTFGDFKNLIYKDI